MDKAKYIISVIIGSVILAQLCPNVSSLRKVVGQLGFNIAGGMALGFWICMIMVVVMISIFILQNVLGLVMVLVYGAGSEEENRLSGILDKISGVSRNLYQAVGAIMFGALGVVGLVHPDVTGRDSVVIVVSCIFTLFALVMCIRAVWSIISIIREK